MWCDQQAERILVTLSISKYHIIGLTKQSWGCKMSFGATLKDVRDSYELIIHDIWGKKNFLPWKNEFWELILKCFYKFS